MLSLKLWRHLWLRPLKLCRRLRPLQIRHRLRPSKPRHRRILRLLPRRLLRMLLSRPLLRRTFRLLHLPLRSLLPRLHSLLGLLGLCKLLRLKTPLLNMAK
jgi:hypothetical protein